MTITDRIPDITLQGYTLEGLCMYNTYMGVALITASVNFSTAPAKISAGVWRIAYPVTTSWAVSPIFATGTYGAYQLPCIAHAKFIDESTIEVLTMASYGDGVSDPATVNLQVWTYG